MWETIAAIMGRKSLDVAFGIASKNAEARGRVGDLIDELKRNALLCELVVKHEADPRQEGLKLSRDAYKKLRLERFDFSRIKKGQIPDYEQTKGTDVEFLSGKTLEESLANISERIQEIVTIAGSTASLERIDLNRRFSNLAKRIAVVVRFISQK